MVEQQNPHVMEVGCLASLTDMLGVGATTSLPMKVGCLASLANFTGATSSLLMKVNCLASFTDLLGVGATTPLLLEEKGRIFSSSGLPFPPDMAISCRIDFKK
jgi:hypothetical protein